MIAGWFHPTPAYAAIQAICRRPYAVLIEAAGAEASLDPVSDGSIGGDPPPAFHEAVLATVALNLSLVDSDGAHIAIVGPLTIQDYGAAGPDAFGDDGSGAMMVAVQLAGVDESPV